MAKITNLRALDLKNNSGISSLKINASSSKPAVNLSVWLVSLPWNNNSKAKEKEKAKKEDATKLKDRTTQKSFGLQLKNRHRMLNNSAIDLPTFNQIIVETGGRALRFKRKKNGLAKKHGK